MTLNNIKGFNNIYVNLARVADLGRYGKYLLGIFKDQGLKVKILKGKDIDDFLASVKD
ncbi:Uncharacterised protein [Granulicatella adiacens]|uniref:hypothetical protein n=1 Tax=Granulicatella adiacens TaxID=46124 RepID=UPI00195D5871|nr:hypothetical protein [Granulicatella adiacens]VTX71345.1 Uncharacterised protein [Granulicatella adiacens]